MTTIPASAFVTINPGVVSAGGSALDLIMTTLTKNTRVPIGTVLSFPSSTAVADFFGLGSSQAAFAAVYFAGFNNSNVKPGSLNYTQYNPVSVPGYLRGGNISGLSLAALQGLSGSLNVVVAGLTYSAGSVNLSSATSFSSAATIIQTDLNTALPAGASVTGAIAPGTASVTASIAGYIMTVTAVASGVLVVGGILSGTGVTSGTQIQAQLSGTTGGIGTYVVSVAQTVASESISETYGTLTVSAVGAGALAVGQTLSGVGVTAGTLLTAFGTGTGGTGTYIVSPTQTVGSEAITATGTALIVTYDSTSGAFIITAGFSGASATVAFATGTIAASLLLTSATGAVLSQGANPATPAAFMTALTQTTQNWASFTTDFDPDAGSGNAQKLLFANWNATQNDRWVYVAWDTDITPTESVPASQSLGSILQTTGASGTCPIYEPSDLNYAAFVGGMIASIDFTEKNGRITAAFKSQSGLVPSVTNETVAFNLGGNPQSIGDFGNGYNYYGAVATANQQFQFFQRGTISGPFLWLDSYVNQIWLNNQFQLALMELLTNVKSLPFNPAGYAMVRAACQDVINAGLNFGAFSAGVELSDAQIIEVNNQAGANIAQTIENQGWYLQILPATAQVRGARSSPPMTFWYADAGSIQALNLASIEVQ